jgi:hypothetical protein
VSTGGDRLTGAPRAARSVSGEPPSPHPVVPRLPARPAYALQRLLKPGPVTRWLAARLEPRPRLTRLFTATERAAKQPLFGCRMCGQCALPATGYACPETCPKQLRNGPCGGVGADGSCEVYPDLRCVWLVAFERAESQGRGADLLVLQPPVDHRLRGQSAWMRYWQGRDPGPWAN